MHIEMWATATLCSLTIWITSFATPTNLPLQAVFDENPHTPLWILLLGLCFGAALSAVLDGKRSGRGLGLVIAIGASAVLAPFDIRQFVHRILHTVCVSVCWGWVTAFTSRLYLISGIIYGVACLAASLTYWLKGSGADATLPTVKMILLFLVAFSWWFFKGPDRPIVVKPQKQGAAQRMMRVRSNGWLLLYALWGAIPRALLFSPLFAAAVRDHETFQFYTLAAIAGVVVMCGLSHLTSNHPTRVVLLNAAALLTTSMSVVWAMHNHHIHPASYVVLTGLIQGGVEPCILTVGMLVNHPRDRVLFIALYLTTASIGAGLGDMIEHIFLATNSAPSMSVIAYLTWVLGTVLLIGLSNAVARDEERRLLIS